MIAMIHGHSKCVALLLASGADHTIKNSIGETAMSIAQMCGQAEIVALLQEHERYLAQVGSHTKPALREPVHQVLQAAEMEESAAGVNLLQTEQLQTVSVADVVQEGRGSRRCRGDRERGPTIR
eukprot:m.325087 g.325087  ORF g.325087 m.325087 type:complete len:124 (-) comp55551_c0_seq3:43-414(-)